jgi:hypothetical protein
MRKISWTRANRFHIGGRDLRFYLTLPARGAKIIAGLVKNFSQFIFFKVQTPFSWLTEVPCETQKFLHFHSAPALAGEMMRLLAALQHRCTLHTERSDVTEE